MYKPELPGRIFFVQSAPVSEYNPLIPKAVGSLENKSGINFMNHYPNKAVKKNPHKAVNVRIGLVFLQQMKKRKYQLL